MTTVWISLGYRCDVAWQIRRRHGQPEAYPFDWLVTPLASIAPMVQDGFRSIADGDCLEVVAYRAGETVLNRRYNVFLHHDFDRAPDVSILPGWRDRIPDVAAKYRHLAERWSRVMAEADAITFIRRNGNLTLPDEAPAETLPSDWFALMDVLEAAAACRPTVVALNCPGLPRRDRLLNARVAAPTRSEWPDARDRWKGNSHAYDQLFAWMAARGAGGAGGAASGDRPPE